MRVLLLSCGSQFVEVKLREGEKADVVFLATVVAAGHRDRWPAVLHAPLFDSVNCETFFPALFTLLFTTVFLCMTIFAGVFLCVRHLAMSDVSCGLEWCGGRHAATDHGSDGTWEPDASVNGIRSDLPHFPLFFLL